MPPTSAGLLMYRMRPPGPQVLLVHPGGPFWANRDLGAWTIPKGRLQPDEEPLVAARREFAEETGLEAEGPFIPLAGLRQPSGKMLFAWACAGDCDPRTIRSNTFSLEWPRRSGQLAQFPEVDRGDWFSPRAAKRKLHRGQVPLVETLVLMLGAGLPL
jgi:predicted NUDIX family NTP pyrophosphohydrolase